MSIPENISRRQFLKHGITFVAATMTIPSSRVLGSERVRLLTHLKYPFGITCTSSGKIIVADAANYCIKIFMQDTRLESVFGSPGSAGAKLNYPQGVAVADDIIYVVDSNNGRIAMFDMLGNFINDFGTIGGYPGAFYTPKGIFIYNDIILVANTRNHTVYKFDKQSHNLLQSFGLLGDDPPVLNKGSYDYRFRLPVDIAVNAQGNIFVTDSKHNLVKVLSFTGEFISQFGGAGTGLGKFNRPEGIAIDSKQNIYVCDSLNKRVQRFSPDGMYMDQIDQGFTRPTGIFIDQDDYVYVADTDSHIVKIFKWS
ncbi:NHL repeat-containing protein [candidate division KSB1 bacterium]|nr:NHL repeat-containing protein [candidate division KSB1 bacterium]